MRVILPGDDALLDARERAALHRIAEERRTTKSPWLAIRCDRWIEELLARRDARSVTVAEVLGRRDVAPPALRDMGGPA